VGLELTLPALDSRGRPPVHSPLCASLEPLWHCCAPVRRAFNAAPAERPQQHPLLFTTHHSDRRFSSEKCSCLWTSGYSFRYGGCMQHRLHIHTRIVLLSKSPNGKCAMLHTVAASNNRDHPTTSLYCCAIYM